MEHTFILEEGIWQGKGKYCDETGQLFSLVGETKIKHNNDLWINESKMIIDIGRENQITIRNNYNIVPFKDGQDFTKWTSMNPKLGKMNGNFIIAGETILSIYNTENEEYIGTESMMKINNRKYRSSGTLLKDNKKVSSWWVDLKRIKD